MSRLACGQQAAAHRIEEVPAAPRLADLGEQLLIVVLIVHRIDGRGIHPAYLFEVKKPSESKGEWDLYKLIGTVPGDQAFTPLAESKCALLKK